MNHRKEFHIKIKGQPVPVSEEIFSVYYKMGRRERYQAECDAAHGTVLYCDLDTDEMLGVEAITDESAKSVEQTVIDGIMAERLLECIKLLSETERKLVDALFFDGMSERQYSKTSGIPHQTINSQKLKIIEKLRSMFGV